MLCRSPCGRAWWVFPGLDGQIPCLQPYCLSQTHTHTGCGTGNYTAVLSKHIGKVTGLELNGGMLAQAKEKTAAMSNVELHNGNILNMPFSDGEFDGVICNQVHV